MFICVICGKKFIGSGNNTKYCVSADCVEKRKIKQREKNRLRAKKYRAKNEKKCKAYIREYNKKNKDKRTSYQREYRIKNKKEVNRSSICVVCNKEFIQNSGNQKCCDSKCYKIYASERSVKYYEANKEKIKARVKKHYKKNNEKIKTYAKRYREKNKDAVRESKQKCVKNNPEKYRDIKIKWEDKNREHLNEKSRKKSQTPERKAYKKKYAETHKAERNKLIRYRLKNDITFRLNCNMSGHIKYDLKYNKINKNRRHWENIVGWTIKQLKNHLENLFHDGMTWKNYGKWEIDHVIPKAFFKYENTDDVEFKYCWSLHNLQPLWKKDNLIKRANVPGFKRFKGEYIKRI